MNIIIMIIVIIVGLILTICLGFPINYIIFRGLQLYMPNPNTKKLSKLKHNAFIAFLFGAVEFGTIYLLKANNLTFEFTSGQFFFILFFICLGIGWFIDKYMEDIPKKNYLTITLAILFFTSVIYLMILEDSSF